MFSEEYSGIQDVVIQGQKGVSIIISQLEEGSVVVESDEPFDAVQNNSWLTIKADKKLTLMVSKDSMPKIIIGNVTFESNMP